MSGPRRRIVAAALLAALAAPFAGDGATAPRGAVGDERISVADSASSPHPELTPGLESILSRLRSRSDANVSAAAREFDAGFRDSAQAAYDSTVAAVGLAGTLVEGGRAPDGYGTGERRWVRTGFTLAPEEGGLDYTKVDGLTTSTAAYGYLTSFGVRARAGGRVGYAFGSRRSRHDAGVELSAHDLELGLHHRRVTDPFGWTDVHGRWLFALAGADELDYLERDGWRVTVAMTDLLPWALTADLAFRREDERSRTARDVFTVHAASSSAARNVAATDGRVHELSVRIARSRFVDPSLNGSLAIQRARGASGGELEYDRVHVRLEHQRRLRWADELSLTFAGQATSSPSGEGPVQVLGDPAGRSGVRGYPHRAFLGTHALLVRVEYRLGRDLFARARIPILSRAHLQLVPFADAGAAWTPAGATRLTDSTLPPGGDWRFGVGAGVRRAVGFGSVLSHLRLDVAWRLDRAGASPVVYFVLEGEPFD